MGVLSSKHLVDFKSHSIMNRSHYFNEYFNNKGCKVYGY